MHRSYFKGAGFSEPTVTYDDIDRMFLEHPLVELEGYRPGRASDPERQTIEEAFNARLYWDGPVSGDLVEFYRKRISRALYEVKNTPALEKGVIV